MSRQEDTTTEKTAIIIARDDEDPDPTEIRRLATAAGYEARETVTQRRREDPTYYVGRGAAETVMRQAARLEPDAVITDAGLTPGQTFSLGELLPAGVEVLDRRRLVLRLFAEGAASRAAELQVELARLRYLKPRVAEALARDAAAEVRLHNEGDRRVEDIERRIRELERSLRELTDRRADRRAERREAGAGVVAIVGYTNAGKSTLLRRLADDLSVQGETTHADLEASASATAADRLFETLETTTRRTTIADRPAVATDTVGFVRELPHEAVRSFEATLEAGRRADVTLLVVDAASPAGLGERVAVTLEALEEVDGTLLPVLNKTDRLEDLGPARTALEAALEDVDLPAADPVAVSALEGAGIAELRERVAERLPAEAATVRLPNGGEAQALLAWAHDHGAVEADYEGERVVVRFRARPETVAQFRAKAEEVG